MNPRARAARLLASVLRERRAFELPPNLTEGPLVAELCYGTLRFAPRLQMLLSQLLERPLRSKDADIEALLLLGLYQIEQMRVPDHAAVDECVTAARQLGKSWAAGLVNAVLRKRLREGDELIRQLSGRPAFDWAHPAWMVEHISRHWPDQAQAIFQANNERPPMTLRVNLRATDRSAYLQMLAEAGIRARPGHIGPAAVILEQPCAVEQIPGFGQGLVSVQDEAAQLSAPLLDARPGEYILDACAAPGGKTCHLLETQSDLRVDACDIDSKRLQKVEENLHRLQLKAQLYCRDAGDPEEWRDNAVYDRILLDAPCSGTGVIRRHPDIKLLRRLTDIEQFTRQQQRLLDNLWGLLRPGGLLLYVTCSIMPEENSDLVTAFLARQADASADEIIANWGFAAGPGRQLLPATEGTDGFYFARLLKRKG